MRRLARLGRNTRAIILCRPTSLDSVSQEINRVGEKVERRPVGKDSVLELPFDVRNDDFRHRDHFAKRGDSTLAASQIAGRTTAFEFQSNERSDVQELSIPFAEMFNRQVDKGFDLERLELACRVNDPELPVRQVVLRQHALQPSGSDVILDQVR